MSSMPSRMTGSTAATSRTGAASDTGHFLSRFTGRVLSRFSQQAADERGERVERIELARDAVVLNRDAPLFLDADDDLERFDAVERQAAVARAFPARKQRRIV